MGNLQIGGDYKLLSNMIGEGEKPKEEPKPKTFFIESTIIRISNDDNTGFQISCNPAVFNRKTYDDKGNLYLSRGNTNFIELYNKLKRNNTYKFEFEIFDNSLNIILNVMDVDTYRISGNIKGFLDISNEKLGMNHSREIIIDGHDNKIRILINSKYMDVIIVGNNYEIEYIKAYEENFYRAVTYKSWMLTLIIIFVRKK